MSFMAYGNFSVYVIGNTVLFHPWVKVDFYHVRSVFFKYYLFNWAAERWINFESNGGS